MNAAETNYTQSYKEKLCGEEKLLWMLLSLLVNFFSQVYFLLNAKIFLM